MATQPTEQQIRHFIVEFFLFGQGAESLSRSDSLLAKGIIDSTGVLEVVSFLEQQYGIHVADEELVPDNFDSIDRLVKYVERKRGA
jgi:acyl carrier protein